MSEPALKFTQDLPHPNDQGNFHAYFRENGYAILNNVFERDSVDAYRDQFVSELKETGNQFSPYKIPTDSPLSVWPAKAPRLRHMLKGCFTPTVYDFSPVLFMPAWIIRPWTQKPEDDVAHGWHKDGDHRCVSNSNGYHSPNVVHVVMYFEDMTPAHGPTYVIPCSHRDPNLSPFNGGDKKEVAFLPKKGDVVLWDQRTWHRGSSRTIPGYRIAAIFAFGAFPGGNGPMTLSPAQREAAMAADDPNERVLFGGPFNLE